MRTCDTAAKTGALTPRGAIDRQIGLFALRHPNGHDLFFGRQLAHARHKSGCRVLIANRFWLSHLYLQLVPDADAEAVVKTVQHDLRERHNRRSDQVDDVIVRDMADVAVQQSSLLAAALWVVSVTSGLLELVGIVGIATLMLQVVRQRRGEIG